MSELQVFNNAEFGSVRSLMVNGEPYFVGKDVADILGYQNGSRDVNRHVDEEDRQKIMVFDGNQDKDNDKYVHSRKCLVWRKDTKYYQEMALFSQLFCI